VDARARRSRAVHNDVRHGGAAPGLHHHCTRVHPVGCELVQDGFTGARQKGFKGCSVKGLGFIIEGLGV
jgi:hypothetical protein